jgi:hypothetical protein
LAVLHPYFKLHYIKLAWGGEEEQAAEMAAGNQHTKNWQEEALWVVKNVVRFCTILFVSPKTDVYQMSKY